MSADASTAKRFTSAADASRASRSAATVKSPTSYRSRSAPSSTRHVPGNPVRRILSSTARAAASRQTANFVWLIDPRSVRQWYSTRGMWMTPSARSHARSIKS